MADYKIICTDQEPVYQPTTHAHIVSVGIDTNNDSRADDKHTKQQVIQNIELGTDRYYTVGQITGIRAFVEVSYCQYCSGKIIKSTPDSTRDNNLDYIRRCEWNS